MVLFYYYHPAFVQRTFGLLQESYSVFVVQLRKDPLDPYAVVLLGELELLETFYVEITDVFLGA